MNVGPTAAVLAAFGVAGPAVPLEGGQGTSFRAGDLVLKASDGLETAWISELVSRSRPVGFQFAQPVRAGNGSWEADGWSATQWAPGQTWQSETEPRLGDILEVCDALQACLKDVECPAFIAARSHRWAVADRMAWGELPVPTKLADDELVADLCRALRQVDLPAQLVHGDVAGNVLFNEGELPTVIDLSLYWRPAAYARAVAVVDGLLWYGATDDEARAEAAIHGPQVLVRATLFRVLAGRLPGACPDEAGWPKSFREVVALVLDLQ